MKRSWLDWLMVIVVVIIAGVVVWLSFHNTAKLAAVLKMNPYGTAFIVEIIFAALLFIRARQRATQRNVPPFIHGGFYISFLVVTGVNMYGLAQENPVVGAIVGLLISGAMWLMENTLVWLWTESDRPHQKSLRELKREAERKIREMKLRKEIEWMLWEAQKPDLDLIQKARKADEKRNKVITEGLPEYFKTVSRQIINEQTISNEIISLMKNEGIRKETINEKTVSLTDNKTVSNQAISKGTINLMENKTISEKSISLTDSERRKEADNNSVSEQSINLMDNENISKQIINETTISGNETISLMKNEPVNLMENKTVSSESISEKSISERIISNENVSEKNVSNETISKENISEQAISNETVSKQNVSEKSISKESVNNQLTKPSNVVDLSEHSKKRTKGRRKKVSPEEIERVKDIARRLLQENPRAGRYTLVEKAGCSHHVAQMVLEELKQSS